LQRVLRGTQQVEQLVALLLVLAKDPKRLAAAADRVALHELVPEIVDDHRPLTRDKQLELRIEALAECEIAAPLGIVQAAIGNLLRNAIEHSDRGTIRVRLDADASVTIADPGHGMSPEEVARIYARLARGESRDGGGIGLDLIARLCEHLGWQLDLDADPDGGTVARLRFKPVA
ncbi:MAG TPA: HAMP domain-containing sensor histidine kinase, partial [Pseudoxanthomonas sp.]|nr:HAMP domain-containing sensor histidine kinase [Pseudoxanthomonas sp.]